ncbi:hypothetical protein Ciccas_013136, partial [Cichlidogyrus casuarinus]
MDDGQSFESPVQLQHNHSYRQSIMRLFTNLPYLLLFISYGINTGVYYALGTLLNDILYKNFQSQSAKIGWAGFVMVIAGILGSIVCGVVLDKTRNTLFTIFFAASIYTQSIGVVIFTLFLLGFFNTGYLPLGFEFAAELTYPENEALTSSLLNGSAQLFGMILTSLNSVLLTQYQVIWANSFLI